MKQVLFVLCLAATGCMTTDLGTPGGADDSSASDSPGDVGDGVRSTERTDDDGERARAAFAVECFAGTDDGEGCNFEQFCQCAQYCSAKNKSCYHYCDLAAGGHCQ